MRWCALVLLCIASCATGPDESAPESRQCEQLRDHLVELQVADVHVASGIDREAHRGALKRALGTDFVASCTGKLTVSQVECGLAATDRSSASGCNTRR